MKKLRLLALVTAIGVLGLVLAPMAGKATSTMRSGTAAGVGKDEVVDSTVYLAGSTVTVAGTVKGDVYCAGQQVDVTGTVEGDVICAGQVVTVSGTVLGDVRIAGQTVSVGGPVARSITVLGQSVIVTGGAVVNLDATILGNTLQLGGKVGRDAVVAGEQVTLAGSVGRSVTATTEKLALGSGAYVGGDVEYTSASQAEKNATATVVGKTVRHEPPASSSRNEANEWMSRFWGGAYWFGAWLVVGLLLIGVAPQSLRAASKPMMAQGGWALLAGLGVLLLPPVITVLLMVTMLGMPAGIIVLLLWVCMLLAGWVYGGYALGQWVAMQAGWNLKWPLVMPLILGLALLMLLMFIPIVGGLGGFLALVWGLGGMTLAIAQSLKAQRGKAAPARTRQS